jgi:hypothetical protein
MGKKLFTKRSAIRIHRPFSWVVSRSREYEGEYLTVTSLLARFRYINCDGSHQLLGKMRVILAACCFALISTTVLVTAAMAESIYKSVMPDGRVMYGEKPQPGARSVKKSTVSISDTGVKPASKAEIDSINRRAQKRSQLLDKTLKTVQTAEDDLRKSEIDREAGIEPLPGERLGIVGRGTRLSEAYWRRQQILEERVDTARQLLKKARQGYNEAR